MHDVRGCFVCQKGTDACESLNNRAEDFRWQCCDVGVRGIHCPVHDNSDIRLIRRMIMLDDEEQLFWLSESRITVNNVITGISVARE